MEDASLDDDAMLAYMAFLDSGNFISVNRTVLELFGLHEAVLLGELASEARYWVENGGAIESDGKLWFYARVEDIERKTSLNAYHQKQAIDNLSRHGIVEVMYAGMPRKRYVRIDFVSLCRIIRRLHQKISSASTQEFLVLTNIGLNKQELSNDSNNSEAPENAFRCGPENVAMEQLSLPMTAASENPTKKKKASKRQEFVPPTPEEVEAYAKTKGYEVDGKYFCDWYEAADWRTKDGTKMTSWKQAVIGWGRRNKNGNYKGGRRRDGDRPAGGGVADDRFARFGQRSV